MDLRRHVGCDDCGAAGGTRPAGRCVQQRVRSFAATHAQSRVRRTGATERECLPGVEPDGWHGGLQPDGRRRVRRAVRCEGLPIHVAAGAGARGGSHDRCQGGYGPLAQRHVVVHSRGSVRRILAGCRVGRPQRRGDAGGQRVGHRPAERTACPLSGRNAACDFPPIRHERGRVDQGAGPGRDVPAHVQRLVGLPAPLDAGRTCRDVPLPARGEFQPLSAAGGRNRDGLPPPRPEGADSRGFLVPRWAVDRPADGRDGWPTRYPGAARGSGHGAPAATDGAVGRGGTDALSRRTLAGVRVERDGTAGGLRASLPRRGLGQVAGVDGWGHKPGLGAQRAGAVLRQP